MKKHLLLTAAFVTSLCFAGLAQAEAPVGATAPAATTAAPAPGSSGQANKMKTCAQQYHQQNIPKSQYHSFMSTCLKKNGTGAATPAAATMPATPPAPASGVTKASTSAPDAAGQTSQQDKMKSCNADAKTQNLTGSARKTFMKSCLSK